MIKRQTDKTRNESVETNEIKRLLLNGTDPIEENPYLIPSVKPISDKPNVLEYSRSLNEDEVDEVREQTKVMRKSSIDAATEQPEKDPYDNQSR